MKTYFVTVYFERQSQNTSGLTSLNMELPDDWTVEYIKDQLASSFFCCHLAVREVIEIKKGNEVEAIVYDKSFMP